MTNDEQKRFHTRPTGKLWGQLKPLARQHRTDPTDAENALWQTLCNRQVAGLKFRRQHAIERFIVDFYCADAQLVIEVDGAIHQYTQEEDAIRQAYLESLGLTVLRFTNDDVLDDIGNVIDRIVDAVTPDMDSDASSPSPRRGEGAGG